MVLILVSGLLATADELTIAIQNDSAPGRHWRRADVLV